jgi:hypothetical protein
LNRQQHSQMSISIHSATEIRLLSLSIQHYTIRRAQVKLGLINLSKGLFSLNARIYYKLKSGT